MITLSESLIIERPPEEVFETAADPFTQLQWDPKGLKQVEKLTPGPLGRGARYRGQATGFGVIEYEFTEFEPPRRFAHLSPLPIGAGRHIFEFEPVSGGTRFTQTVQVEPKGVFKLLAPVMKGMMRMRMRQLAGGLRHYLVAENKTVTQA